MITRIIFAAGVALVLSAHSAGAQGRQQQIIFSQATLKAMTAQKTKTKTPLLGKVGMVRRAVSPSAAISGSTPRPAPASVSEIRRGSSRK